MAARHGTRLGDGRVLDASRIHRSSASDREAARGRQSGRTQEIQRLIGRSLRAVTDLEMIAELQITVDCDVLQADGGTRTAAICGGYVALHDAFSRMVATGTIPAHTRHRRVRGDLGREWSTRSRTSTSTTPRTCAPRST